LAGEPASRYVEEVLLRDICAAANTEVILPGVAAALSDGRIAFQAFLYRYLFHKSGQGTSPFAVPAVRAVNITVGGDDFYDLLESEDYDALWDSFEEACRESGNRIKDEDLHRLLSDTFALACEVYLEHGSESLFSWISDQAFSTKRLQHIFERLTGIRGFGPKNASLLLRDAAFVYDFEDVVRPRDRPLLMPVFGGLRRLADQLWAEEQRPADHAVATYFSDVCQEIGVSGVRFNMGAAYVAGAR
jgi:hypothetical protein